MRSLMKKFSRPLVIFLWLLLAGARAQIPSPLVSDRALAATVPGGGFVAEGRANAALQAGFPATAAIGYREILAVPNLTGETKQRVALALVSALMDAGELPAAEKVLQEYDGPKNSAYHLRAGLLAANARRWPQAKAAWAACKIDELAPADRGWWHFLQATLADADNDHDRRNKAYEEADKAAVSELQRLRFLLGQEQARLRVEPPNETQLTAFRTNMERMQGTRPGYDYTRVYAAALSMLGRKGEALTVLQRQLLLLPATERNSMDQFRLLIGLIAGAGSEDGRRALLEILNRSSQPETQKVALLLLAQAAKTTPERERLRNNLGELIGAPVTSTIIEDLLLVSAQAALADRQYTPAEEEARTLLERYPGSPLKAAALGVRLSVAWELKRYRNAADVSAQLRTVLPEGRERAELRVLLAEAFFRSGDYANAADAYDAALHDAPLVMPAGELIFQRVLSDIRAQRLEAAAKLLDEMAGNPAFDAVSRWQAEWNLVKEMQVRRQATAAQARVEKLLKQGSQGVNDELRIRLLWLQAKLSFDNGQSEAAVKRVDELVAVLPSTKIDAGLRDEVASTALLVKAEALLALGRDDAAGMLLEKLRVDYKNAKAAVYSYIVQAEPLSAKGETVKAQQLLIKLADEHPDSEFAPLALYQAALNAERRGLDEHLREAYNLLETLVNKYKGDELVFYARLKQGDLLRKLNDFNNARQFYDALINNNGQHPDVELAQLAKGYSLFAQGGNSVVNAQSAAAIFERLRDLPTVSIDLRVEAGCMWGTVLAKRRSADRSPAESTQTDKAVTVYWSVVNDFLLDATQAANLGAKGRWWMSRCLLELGQLLEEAGRLDEAQHAYQLIIDQHLGGALLAQDKLARFRAAEGNKP
jgi:TolA-binding protein